MSARFIGSEAGDPCRDCRGTGHETTDSGCITSCFHCGGSGLKSIRAEGDGMEKNAYTGGRSPVVPIYGSGGYWTEDDLAYAHKINMRDMA